MNNFKKIAADAAEKYTNLQEGGMPSLRGVAEADELRARGGLAAVNKKPRTGQTDMRNIPVGNHPGARINKFTDKDREEQPGRLKAKIKATLGKHTRPNLPEEVDQLDEVMFGDKANKQALSALLRHSELAMAAKKDGDHQAVKYHRTKMDNIRNQMAKPAKEEVEPIDEISKDLAKSCLDKTVDPVYGMPRHGMKDRMQGIRQASIRVLKKADKSKIKTN